MPLISVRDQQLVQEFKKKIVGKNKQASIMYKAHTIQNNYYHVFIPKLRTRNCLKKKKKSSNRPQMESFAPSDTKQKLNFNFSPSQKMSSLKQSEIPRSMLVR